MKKILLTFVTIIFISSSLSAGDAGQESPFSIGAGARALGMGGGFTSIADDASAVFYNPAGLPYVSHQELSLMYMDLFAGTSYQYLGWVYPDSKGGGVGIAILRIATDDIRGTDNYISTGNFDYSHTQYLLGYGRKLNENLAIGLTFKIANQSIDSLSDYGIGFDLGLIGSLSKYISTGFQIRDLISPELELGRTSESTPITFITGLSLNKYPISDYFDLTASIDIQKPEKRDNKFHFGTELLFDDTYVIRSGYDRDNLSFGVGMVNGHFKIDYSYKVMDFIDDSHRFSMTVMIGKSVKENQMAEEEIIQKRGTDLLEDEKHRQYRAYRQKADDFYDEFKLDSASIYYQRALAFDEYNTQVIGLIAGINNSIEIQRETEARIKTQHDELLNSINQFMIQAENFFDKKYYGAAMDMVNLVFEYDPGNFKAKSLKLYIENAVAQEITTISETALAAEKEGDNLKALQAYNRLLELDPENIHAKGGMENIASKVDIAQQLNKGIKAFNENKFRSASKIFSEVLTIDHNNPVAREYLKKIDQTREIPATLEDLQKNKAIWQKYLVGIRYMRDAEYEKAIESWNEVLKVYPNNTNTLNNIEQARLRLKSEQSK